MFISTSQFVALRLPALMRDRRTFRVLLASYRDFGYIAHRPHGLARLEIITRQGNLAYAGEGPGGRMVRPQSAEEMVLEAHMAQDAVERALDGSARFDLAVVYLGLTGFDKAWQYALRLKRIGGVSSLAVLTCDCDEERKAAVLGPYAGRAIADALITPACGGQGDFQAIYDGILKAWPKSRRS